MEAEDGAVSRAAGGAAIAAAAVPGLPMAQSPRAHRGARGHDKGDAMPWVIVIGAAIALCYVFPKFRKFVGSLVWLLVLLVGGYTLYSGYADYRSSKRISPDQVEITGLELRENRLTGRVRNNSPKYTLTSVSLKLTVRDVVEEGGTETVAETAETLLVDVPPGRSRHFEEPLFFSGLEKPRGRFQWDYRVTGTRGK